MGSVLNRGSRSEPKWYLKYREGGRQVMVRARVDTKARAERMLREAEARIAEGLVGIEVRGEERTFGDLLDHWLNQHSAVELRSHDANVSRAKLVRAELGNLPLSQVTAERIDAFRAKLARDPARRPAGTNRILALVRKALNDGERWGWIKHAPKVRMVKVSETPFDFLSRKEVEDLLTWSRLHAPTDFALYAAAILVGARQGELYALRWADVDLDRQQLTIARSNASATTKSGKVRRVDIGPDMLAIMKEWRLACPRGPHDLVFPLEDGSPRPAEKPPLRFRDHLKAAGCHQVRFHDLRHTCASLMVMSVVQLRTVQQILGHSTVTVTEKYAHLQPDFTRREVAKVQVSIGTSWGEVVSMSADAG